MRTAAGVTIFSLVEASAGETLIAPRAAQRLRERFEEAGGPTCLLRGARVPAARFFRARIQISPSFRLPLADLRDLDNIFDLHDAAATAAVAQNENPVAQLLDALELSLALAPVRALTEAVKAEAAAGDTPTGPSPQAAECLRYQNEFRLLYGERIAGDGRPWSELLR